MKITIPMKINSEKKHSVRYDAKDNDAGVTSVYIMKSSLTTPYPSEVTISVEWNKE